MLLHRHLILGIAAIGCSGLIGAVGCSATNEEPPTSALDNALNAQDFDTTVKELAALPWLPWTYLTDGCYARALYYSMLLATKGVPTNHLYAVAKPGTTLFGIWSWHVAPLVTKDGDPNHLYVLDPAYDQTKALTNVEWGAKELWPDPSAPKYPTFHVHPGNSFGAQGQIVDIVQNPASPVAANYKEPAIADMPAFTMDTVSYACNTMHLYIDRETTTDAPGKAGKHKDLAIQTQVLVSKLLTQDKISGNPALPATCTRGLTPDATGSSSGTVDATGGTSGAVDTTGAVGTSGGSAGGTGADFVDPTRIPVPQ